MGDFQLISAIELNNRGVNLVIRGRFEEAMTVFKDALEIMRMSSNHLVMERSTVNQMLMRTRKLSARTGETAPGLKYALSGVASSEDSPSSLPVNPSYLPLRMDPVELSDYDVDYQSSVILYNYGIALQGSKDVAKSYHIHQLAETLCKQQSKVRVTDNRFLLLLVLLNRSLMEASVGLGIHNDSLQHLETMEMINFHLDLWQGIHNVSVAPAA